jgi:hypothetical protein
MLPWILKTKDTTTKDISSKGPEMMNGEIPLIMVTDYWNWDSSVHY